MTVPAITLAAVEDRGVKHTRASVIKHAEAEYAALDAIVRRLKPGTVLPGGHPATGKGLVGGRSALYVCRNMTCEPPVTDPGALRL